VLLSDLLSLNCVQFYAKVVRMKAELSMDSIVYLSDNCFDKMDELERFAKKRVFELKKGKEGELFLRVEVAKQTASLT